jgi:hypothetical protein
VLKLSGLERLAQSANAEPVGDVANLDDTLHLAPQDTTDHLTRIEGAEKRAVAITAAAVQARKLIEAAQEKDAPGFAYDVQDLAWTLVEKTPQEIDAAEEEARDELEDPEDEDALGAVQATFELGRGLRTLVIELRDSFPEPDPLEELTDRLNEAETVAEAEERAKRIASRFETARALRALLGTYGRKVVEHLAAWPQDERDEEEEALRSVVFGEDA